MNILDVNMCHFPKKQIKTKISQKWSEIWISCSVNVASDMALH